MCQHRWSVPWPSLPPPQVGAVNATFGIKGVQEHCFFLKSMEDAQQLRRHVRQGQLGGVAALAVAGADGQLVMQCNHSNLNSALCSAANSAHGSARLPACVQQDARACCPAGCHAREPPQAAVLCGGALLC